MAIVNLQEVFMTPGILGRKIGMTQVFRADGQVVPVTLLKAGPCVVVQRKTPVIDGYNAVQLGLMEFVKPARINKPRTGHLKKANVEGVKFLNELNPVEAMEFLIQKLSDTKTNKKFLESMNS